MHFFSLENIHEETLEFDHMHRNKKYFGIFSNEEFFEFF
jgi:hypothetical protein